ncbi:hypothetical protein [Streptomyces sp. NPDC048187]|uniref:hypothetical protein n=1 Tax=Streptomyces sp. NPDC048187 TaxID=3365509 RepID=UPI0037116B7A
MVIEMANRPRDPGQGDRPRAFPSMINAEDDTMRKLRIPTESRHNRATSAKSTRWRFATTAAALAATSVLGLVTAAPASAAVKQTCGTYICVATAYQGTRYVQDITVFTRDGLPGTLRAFAADYRNSRANDDRHVFTVNRELGQPGTGRLAVCGGLDRSGRVIENHCVLIP